MAQTETPTSRRISLGSIRRPVHDRNLAVEAREMSAYF